MVPFPTMETTIDRAGRLVLPKAVRAALGLLDGGRVEISEREGEVTIRPLPASKRLSQNENGQLVCVADEPLPPLTVEMIRDALESGRR
jgi:AbrB family looped-hinge helix DNA binding protein